MNKASVLKILGKDLLVTPYNWYTYPTMIEHIREDVTYEIPLYWAAVPKTRILDIIINKNREIDSMKHICE